MVENICGSPIGHRHCHACLNNPSYRLHPCGHTACKSHHEKSSEATATCDHCGSILEYKSELPNKTPTLGAASPAGNYLNASLTMPSSTNDSSNRLEGLGAGIGPNMSNNKYAMLARNMDVPSTPTPGARDQHGHSSGTMKQAGAYVPPQRRSDPIQRPDSSLSTTSFVSQVPTKHFAGSPHGSDPFMSQRSTPIAGHYRLTPNNLPDRFSRIALYEHQQHAHQPRNSFIFDRTTRAPPSQLSGDALDNSSGGVPLPRQPHGDEHDIRAARLAEMIKAGMMDNPRDPDYGNPGPSKRAPALVKTPVQKLKRGDVVAGTGQVTSSPDRRASKEAPNINGNAVAFLNTKDVKLPPWFSQISRGYFPTLEEFLPYIPLIEPCTLARPSTAGVVQIANIPYGVSRSEIVALLGSQAKLCPQPPGTGFLAVHIIMERQSGKTLDAYVEVESEKEARTLVNQFAGRTSHKRPPKLGDRQVEVILSNRDALMAAIFPCAKNVTWTDGVPKIDDHVEHFFKNTSSTGFSGFLQDEEIYHMAKHAEMPQRSPFAQRCLIRTYECLITTLYKYPWFAVDFILEAERLRLYYCTKTSIRALVNILSKTKGNHRAEPHKPTVTTLKEVAVAALTCPGFTEKEKAQIVADLRNSGYHQLTRPQGMNLRFGGNHPHAEDWPFKVAAKQPGTHDQMMEFFASLMRDATRGDGASLNDLYSLHHGQVSSNFGAVNINYGSARTFGEAARVEVAAIQSLLSRVLQCGPSPGSRTGSTVS